MMIKHAVDQCTYIIVFLLFLFCYPLEPIDIDIVLIIIFKNLFLILIYKNKKN